MAFETAIKKLDEKLPLYSSLSCYTYIIFPLLILLEDFNQNNLLKNLLKKSQILSLSSLSSYELQHAKTEATSSMLEKYHWESWKYFSYFFRIYMKKVFTVKRSKKLWIFPSTQPPFLLHNNKIHPPNTKPSMTWNLKIQYHPTSKKCWHGKAKKSNQTSQKSAISRDFCRITTWRGPNTLRLRKWRKSPSRLGSVISKKGISDEKVKVFPSVWNLRTFYRNERIKNKQKKNQIFLLISFSISSVCLEAGAPRIGRNGWEW